jgi:4-amino-4-deoxy-L-arabinose transferase-like glycosyltransferase
MDRHFNNIAGERNRTLNATETAVDTLASRLNLEGCRGTLVLLLILAFLTSSFFFGRFQDFYTPDSLSYTVPAANLSSGHGFTDIQGNPETLRTPGFPILVSLFFFAGLDLKYLIVFQHLLRLLIIVSSAAFAFRIMGNQRVALLTGTVLCLDLPFLESANVFMTEVFFTAILAVVLWLLWIIPKNPKSYASTIVAGLISGASSLVRPVSLFFFIPASAYLLFTVGKFRMRQTFTFLLAFLLLPLTWAARNYHETGYFTFSSISGSTMLLYRAAGTLAVGDPGEFSVNLQRRQAQLVAQACEQIKTASGKDCSQISIPERAIYYTRLGRTIVLTHPIDYAKVVLRGEAELILGGGLNRLTEITGIKPRAGKLVILIYTLPLLCFSLVGLFVLWKENRQLFILIVFVAGYFILISGGAEAYSRFRVPVMPLYAFSAALGLDSMLRYVSEGMHARVSTTGETQVSQTT